ncbi:MAG TPA: class I SAM-dependent methyltransferase [Candidatus Bathyarchaeia archaeon]|nr:class I SAM-dependent methyltransferase [Candidatus Bathyarchaeia archaeon]
MMKSDGRPVNNIPYIFGSGDDSLTKIIAAFGLAQCRDRGDGLFILEICDGRLQIRSFKNKNLGGVYVEFASGKAAHRRIFGSYRNEAIVKAVGFKKDAIPSVLDLTAGLGRDAFVLASAGCRVHMIERCPVVAALLSDGLERARRDDEIGPWVRERMSLSCEDSLNGLAALPFQPDVVYIDAMFPEKKKSALVRKEIQLLQIFVGEDADQDQLLKVGQKMAQCRVVVKRPNFAGYLNHQKPHSSLESKNYRFDVYPPTQKT